MFTTVPMFVPILLWSPVIVIPSGTRHQIPAHSVSATCVCMRLGIGSGLQLRSVLRFFRTFQAIIQEPSVFEPFFGPLFGGPTTYYLSWERCFVGPQHLRRRIEKELCYMPGEHQSFSDAAISSSVMRPFIVLSSPRVKQNILV